SPRSSSSRVNLPGSSGPVRAGLLRVAYYNESPQFRGERFRGPSLMADNHHTEAACLLEQGATYHRRIGFEPVASPGDPVFAGFKPGAFSLYFGDAPIYHFDLEGRWQRAFVD